MNTGKQKEVRKLELQIAINEGLPADLRCDEAIAGMKTKLAALRQWPNLKLIKSFSPPLTAAEKAEAAATVGELGNAY